jgi:hypothetical protein
MSLRIVPVEWPHVRDFVDDWHRHNKPPTGYKFGIGVADDNDVLRGVAAVGRTTAPGFPASEKPLMLEVTRVATDGYPNANSMLYGAAWRAVKAMGYRRLITYTQASESGSSLRAAGWVVVAELPPRKGWDTPSRRRNNDEYLSVLRLRWEAS